MADNFNILDYSPDFFVPNQVVSGEETVPRQLAVSGSVTAATGVLLLTFFTARKTEVTTQGTMRTGTTAAAATPTLCRFGLYEVDAAGDGLLVASHANDTALFANTFTSYTKSWTASYLKRAGQRYAWATIVVSAGAVPTFQGVVEGSAFATNTPRLHGTLASQTDLPTSFTNASLGNASNSGQVLALVLP